MNAPTNTEKEGGRTGRELGTVGTVRFIGAILECHTETYLKLHMSNIR